MCADCRLFTRKDGVAGRTGSLARKCGVAGPGGARLSAMGLRPSSAHERPLAEVRPMGRWNKRTINTFVACKAQAVSPHPSYSPQEGTPQGNRQGNIIAL